MKRSIKQNLALNTLGILLLCNWGNNDEKTDALVGGGKKPEVNFYGTVIDNTGTTVNANDITISGMYRQIPVYLEPKDLTQKDYNPADNIARLDLAEISKISIENPEKLYTFLNRTYIEIHVLSNDNKTTNKYIIETSKKVLFDEVNESGPIEREVALTALQEVNVKGYNKDIKPAVNEVKSNAKDTPKSNTPEPESKSLLLSQYHHIIPHDKPVIVPGLLG
jgi:hypothetical protein